MNNFKQVLDNYKVAMQEIAQYFRLKDLDDKIIDLSTGCKWSYDGQVLKIELAPKTMQEYKFVFLYTGEEYTLSCVDYFGYDAGAIVLANENRVEDL